MPFCPKCKFEYLPEVSTCPDCNIPLSSYLPSTPAPTAEEETQEVFTTDNPIELNLALGLLRENGITAVVSDPEGNPWRHFDNPPQFCLRVLLPDADRARQLLSIYLSSEAMKYLCESCGAELAEFSETCPRCGKSPTG